MRQVQTGSAAAMKEPASAALAAISANRISSGRTSRLLRSRSGTDSPRSIDSVRSRQVSSPLRPARNVQSPSLDSGDESSIRVERATYQHMFQDIVSIKTMLLKLKRVLQESGENGLTRAETLNPFDNSVKNGLFYGLNEGHLTDASTSPGSGGSSVADELADLRRQVVFLQGQLEDKDRTIQEIQFKMSKLQLPGEPRSAVVASCNGSHVESCNAATQTEKIRPVSAGPTLLQSLPQDSVMGPLVSWSDSWDRGNAAEAGCDPSRPLRSRLDRDRARSKDSRTTSRADSVAKSSIPTRRAPRARPVPVTGGVTGGVTGRSHNL